MHRIRMTAALVIDHDRRGRERGDTVAADTTSRAARFERVVLPHLDAAYSLARHLMRDATDAEDAVQEAILRAIRYFDSMQSETSARAWLLAIVRRECLDLIGTRRTTASEPSNDDGPMLRLVDPAPLPDSAAHHRLLHARVLQAVNALPDRLREALILREIQQCSYEEIATIIDAPIGTVMSRLSRARARVADALRDVVDAGEMS